MAERNPILPVFTLPVGLTRTSSYIILYRIYFDSPFTYYHQFRILFSPTANNFYITPNSPVANNVRVSTKDNTDLYDYGCSYRANSGGTVTGFTSTNTTNINDLTTNITVNNSTGVVTNRGTTELPSNYVWVGGLKTGTKYIDSIAIEPLANPSKFIVTNYALYNYAGTTLYYNQNIEHYHNAVDSGAFIPDDGTGPDEGGGNKTDGQGNPTTDTEGGTFDNESDAIAAGSSTSIKAAQYFNNYYALNFDHITHIKHNIWGFTIPGLTKPSEALISLILFPFTLDSISDNTNQGNVKIGNSIMPTKDDGDPDNPVWMLKANYDNLIDFGSIILDPYFGGFQDFAPYTKLKIYLPFIGERELDPTYVQGKNLTVKYNVNFSNGSCIANIYSDGYLYTRFNGQIGQTVPLTQVNNTLIEATVGTAIQSAALAVVNPAVGAASMVTGSLQNIVHARPSISGSAGGGGECELSLPLEAYLIIERPHCAIAQTYNHEKGRPSLVNKKLSNCKGFTSMSNPQVTAACTSEENDRINAILKTGVIINA